MDCGIGRLVADRGDRCPYMQGYGKDLTYEIDSGLSVAVSSRIWNASCSWILGLHAMFPPAVINSLSSFLSFYPLYCCRLYAFGKDDLAVKVLVGSAWSCTRPKSATCSYRSIVVQSRATLLYLLWRDISLFTLREMF